MNRRSFFSLLAGAAGAPLVPWRGLIDPIIVLAGRQSADAYYYASYWNSSPRKFSPTHLSIDPRDGLVSIGGYFSGFEWDTDSYITGTVLTTP